MRCVLGTGLGKYIRYGGTINATLGDAFEKAYTMIGNISDQLPLLFEIVDNDLLISIYIYDWLATTVKLRPELDIAKSRNISYSKAIEELSMRSADQGFDIVSPMLIATIDI